MALYHDPEAAFFDRWFGADATEIEPLQWRHWPAAAPLFAGPFAGIVRLSAGGLLGRRVPENPLLALLGEEERRRRNGAAPSSWVLRAKGGDAVLGLASAIAAPAWPDARLVDIYCHPNWWHQAGQLLSRLPVERPKGLAYCDADFAPKRAALEAAGFKAVAVIPQWIATDAAKTGYTDLVVYTKLTP
jgi:hypothetical protein